MMNNSFLNPYNTVNLTGSIDITATMTELISIDEKDDEQIINIPLRNGKEIVIKGVEDNYIVDSVPEEYKDMKHKIP